MQTLIYIEDLLTILYRKIQNYEIMPQYSDVHPITSFVSALDSGKLLTRKQGNYILHLLKRYRSILGIENIDDYLNSPVWKNDFRVIDTSKYIYLETETDGVTWLNAKFPYSFRDQFVKELFNGDRDPTKWDPEAQSRKVRLSEINLVTLVENALKHKFEIDEQVFDALAYIEELWNNEDSLVPYSMIIDGKVEIINAAKSAIDFWNEHKTEKLAEDLLLAKQMGFILKNGTNVTVSEKIASTLTTSFWFMNPEKFYNYIDELQVWPVLIILDRTPEPISWTKEFIEKFPFKNFVKDDIRICFRPSNNDRNGKNFNDWLKDQHLNKPVAEGKIFVCQQKPPKWMFENNFKIKVAATNSIYPSVNSVTNSLFSSHPSVFYFDKVKPSSKRNVKIAEL